MYQNYLLDLLSLRFSRLGDGALRFSLRPAAPADDSRKSASPTQVNS